MDGLKSVDESFVLGGCICARRGYASLLCWDVLVEKQKTCRGFQELQRFLRNNWDSKRTEDHRWRGLFRGCAQER